MKKLFQSKTLLLSALLLSAGLMSCRKDKDSGTTSPNGEISCQVTQLEMSNQFGGYTTSFNYASNGLLVETSTEAPYGIHGNLFTYNQDKQVMVREEYSGASKEVNFKATYTYGEHGVAEVKWMFPVNGNFTTTQILRYSYDQNGMVDSVLFFSADDVFTGYQLFTYDNNANVNYIVQFEEDGFGGFFESMRRTLLYDGKATLPALTTAMLVDPNFRTSYNVVSDNVDIFDMDTQSWKTDMSNTYSYTYTASGYPETITVNGIGHGTFSYSCK